MAAFMRTTTAFFQGQQSMLLSKQITALSLNRMHTISSISTVPNKLQRIPEHHANVRAYSSSATASMDSSTQTQTTELPNDPKPKVDSPTAFDPVFVDSLFQKMTGDLPISDMSDPFVKDYRRCFLCKQNVKLDHKNVRLLSQFVSPYTGRIYGRAVTGLCIPLQKHVARLIKRSRKSGYMPFILKDPRYLQDPQPFDPMAQRKVGKV